MEPVLSVTIGAVLAIALTSFVWWRNTRALPADPNHIRHQSENQALKAELVGLRLALLEAVRPTLAAKEREPSTIPGLIDRLALAHRESRNENRQLRAQLGSATRRLAQLKTDLARMRQGGGDQAMREYLAQVSSERDALQEKVADLARRVRRANPTTRDALNAARAEIDRLRSHLRSANHAIAALDDAAVAAAAVAAPMPLAPGHHVQVDLDASPTEPSQDRSRPPLRTEHYRSHSPNTQPIKSES
jgi:DNA repair exonuclease SbcCD ATPase subunit